jgi:L-fuconolactonase
VIVDSHVHVSTVWYEPVESLLFQMDRHGVEKAVLIQMFGQTDNRYELASAAQHADRLAPVVIVDAAQTGAVDELRRLRDAGAAGVRLTATTRSPGSDPLAIWRTADALSLPVSCSGSSTELLSDEFAALLAELPSLSVVIEHLGGNTIVIDPDEAARRTQVFALARLPNTTLRFHGLGEICRRQIVPDGGFPFEPDNLELLDAAFAAFGADRMMWGSDYPPVSGREGYGLALRLPQEHFGGLSETERAAMFGGVADRVFFKT